MPTRRDRKKAASTANDVPSGDPSPIPAQAADAPRPDSDIAPSSGNDKPGDTAAQNKPSDQESAPAPELPSWPSFVQNASENDIRERFIAEARAMLGTAELSKAAVIAILRPEDSLNSFDLDQIYEALMNLHSTSYDAIVLFLLSSGGQIEPAYQISKLCKTFAQDGKFVVVVPRHAKSAATLMALGADEIHMGPLGQLGPIDPQIGGLPALGVSQALQTIAGLVQQYPKSAEMFSQYLRAAVKVEHIGYSDRVAESAVQYAERLLASKPYLASRAPDIARQLVYAYKDHSFVIDADESQRILGPELIKLWSSIETVGEHLYSHFDWVNFWLSSKRKKRLIVSGAFDGSGVLLLAT